MPYRNLRLLASFRITIVNCINQICIGTTVSMTDIIHTKVVSKHFKAPERSTVPTKTPMQRDAASKLQGPETLIINRNKGNPYLNRLESARVACRVRQLWHEHCPEVSDCARLLCTVIHPLDSQAKLGVL